MAVQQSFYEALEEAANKSSKPCADLDVLVLCGKHLDEKFVEGFTVRDLLMAALLKIRAKSGNEENFVPNRAQRQIAARWGRRNIVLKARQMGTTTYIAARFFVDTITHPGTLTVQVAHDQQAAEDIFRMVHRFQANLPKRLQKGALKTCRANSRQLAWARLDSEYRVATAGDPNAGRGTTIRNLHCSEVAMWSRDGAEALASLRAAVPPDGQIVLESTPNGAGGAFYEEWQRAGGTGYVRHFLPWWFEKSYRTPGLMTAGELSQEEQELRDKHGLDDHQILYRRDLKANYTGKFKQEYAENAEECFLASGDCVFDAEVLEKQLKALDGSWKDKSLMKNLDVFLPVQPNKRYIIGVDTAAGGSRGDYSCAQVIDRESGMQCAELHGHIAPDLLGRQVAQLSRLYNDALVVVEQNNHGHAVLVHLEHAGCNNIYDANGKNGFVTNAASRPRTIENMVNLVNEEPTLFKSSRLIRECRTFVRQPDASPRASNGAHDDTVMAMAIAQIVRTTCPRDRRNGTNQRE